MRAERQDRGQTAALLAMTLERGTSVPLSRQLYLQISESIRNGRLAPGARLTSTRRLSSDLGVSRTVTLAAFEQLISEGYVEARRGSGQYVRAIHGVVKARRATTAARSSGENGITAVAVETRPFDPASQVECLFPRDMWIRLLGRSWRRQGAAAEAAGHWAGLFALREAVAQHVYSLRGIACSADQVLITSGNADALRLIVDALAPTASARQAGVWIENPGHLGARRAFAQSGMRIISVPVDDAGIDVEAGRAIGSRARFALVTPSRQFPLGMPLTLDRRLALVRWAREQGAIVIEDDYDTELRFSGRPIASLLSLDPRLEALSLGSFSKLTFSGLRLGYIIGPRHLIDKLTATRARFGTPVATTAQPALAALLDDGGFAKHLRALRKLVTARRAALITALAETLAEKLTIIPQEVGMHLTVTLRRGTLRDTALSAKAQTVGLSLAPLSAHDIRPKGWQGFLLGYAGWSEAELRAAVRVLATLIPA